MVGRLDPPLPARLHHVQHGPIQVDRGPEDEEVQRLRTGRGAHQEDGAREGRREVHGEEPSGETHRIVPPACGAERPHPVAAVRVRAPGGEVLYERGEWPDPDREVPAHLHGGSGVTRNLASARLVRRGSLGYRRPSS